MDTVFPEFMFFEDNHGEVEGANLSVVQLSQETSEFLKKLVEIVTSCICLAVFVKNGKAHVTEGPLVSYDERIVKVDRHKRICWVKMDEKVDMRTNLLMVGLEIYAKD